MDKLLSIIVPSYNMEKYLPKCLGSLIVDEKIGRENRSTAEGSYLDLLDVIVVNDGSKDRTSEIAHEFEKKYPGVFRVIDKENGHYGSCVNAGLKVAAGKYVKVLDADDYVDRSLMPEYLQFLEVSSADLVLSDFEVVDGEGRVLRTYSYATSGDDRLSVEHRPPESVDVHSVAYRKQIFEGLNYHQTEGILYSDTEWRLVPLLQVRTIDHFNRVLGKYLIGRCGQSMEREVYIRNYADGLVTMKAVADAIHRHVAAGRLVPMILQCQFQDHLLTLYRMVFYDYSDRLSYQVSLMEFDNALEHLVPDAYAKLADMFTIGCRHKMSVLSMARKFPRSYRIWLALFFSCARVYKWIR